MALPLWLFVGGLISIVSAAIVVVVGSYYSTPETKTIPRASYTSHKVKETQITKEQREQLKSKVLQESIDKASKGVTVTNAGMILLNLDSCGNFIKGVEVLGEEGLRLTVRKAVEIAGVKEFAKTAEYATLAHIHSVYDLVSNLPQVGMKKLQEKLHHTSKVLAEWSHLLYHVFLK